MEDIPDIPSGWITTKNGEQKHQKIEVGQLTQLLVNALFNKLEYNLLSGEPELNRFPIESWTLENFYIPLSEIGWRINKTAATDALLFASQKNSYHPVVDYLERIELNDSVEPIDLDHVALEYLATNDSLYDAMLAACLIGAVARAFHRGCKFDNCLVLKGPEGIRKSTFFKVLCSEDWFCDTWQQKPEVLFMTINQCWFYELAEIDSITSKTAQGRLKAILSSATDIFKKPYARGTGKFPRPSILVATSNRCDFLSDPSASHRRFWVVPLNRLIDTARVKRDRDRIFKAAILAYRNGRKPLLTQKQQEESNLRNQNFQADHPFMNRLIDWVENQPLPFTTEQALIGSDCRAEDKITTGDLIKASEALNALGYRKDDHQSGPRKNRKRFWRKSELPD